MESSSFSKARGEDAESSNKCGESEPVNKLELLNLIYKFLRAQNLKAFVKNTCQLYKWCLLEIGYS